MQYIEGDPRERWMHWWIENVDGRPAVTWEQFCAFLLNLLDDPLTRLLDAYEKYSDAKQRENQTARVFLTYLESLESQMEPYTPLQKLYHYYARLRPELRRSLTNYGKFPQDREELCNLATRYEKNMRDTRKAKAKDREKSKETDKFSRGVQRGSPGQQRSKDKDRSAGKPHRTPGYSQNYPIVPSKDETVSECFLCKKVGHYAKSCPDAKKLGSSNPNHTLLKGKKKW